MRLIAILGFSVLLAAISAAQTSPPAALPWTGANLFDAYGRLTDRIVLRSSALPRLNEIIPPDLVGKPGEMVAFIETVFARHGIEIAPDGEKFVQLRRAGWSASPPAAALERLDRPASGGEIIPAGSITWSGAELNFILDFYSRLVARTVLRPSHLSCPPIWFRNQQPLTRAELIYALRVLLALNGIALVEDGQTFVHATFSPAGFSIPLRAPTPEPDARRIEPRRVPVFTPSSAPRPRPPPHRPAWVQWTIDLVKPLYFRTRTALLGPPPPPPRPNAGTLLAFYARLTNTTPLPARPQDTTPIHFEIITPVTQAELLYAIEATLARSGLAIVTTNQTFVRLAFVHELPKSTNLPPALPPQNARSP